MQLLNRPYRFLFLVIAACIGQGCTTVRPYQRAYLNDERMQLGQRPIDNPDENTHAYREGSLGGGGGKASGGCGCN
ncbi:MAG: DUF4266 domain-containing protein [Bacteroidetes bacterium]|nr:DUF4266 domain-containing protein [Fibrella sp.]